MIRLTKYSATHFVIWACSVVILVFGLFRLSPRGQTERTLANGAPVTASLTKGEAHRYLLRLDAGQFARVESKALTDDITLELFAPDGTSLMKMKARNWIPEGNSVAAIADEMATYLVEIKAMDPQKDAVSYQIRISESRPAGQADRLRCQGEYLFAAGEQIYDQRTKEAWEQAIEKYEAALPYFEKAEDWFGAARDVETKGEAYLKLAAFRDAQDAFDKAFLLVKNAEPTTQTRSLEAKIDNNMGVIADEQYDKQNALLHYSRALAVFRQLGNSLAEGVCLMNIGNVYNLTGRPEEALRWYDQSLRILKELGNRRQLAALLNSRGAARYYLEQYQQAIEDQTASLDLWRNLGDAGEEGWTLNHIAANHLALLEAQTALELLNEALPLVKKGGNRSDEASVRYNLGNAYRLLGQFDMALEYYQQALELRQPLNESVRDALTIGKISETERTRGNLAEALLQSDRALALIEQVRQQYSNPLLAAGYSSATHQLYADRIALLFELQQRQPASGYNVQAFQTSERAHARALLESLSNLGKALQPELPAEQAQRVPSLQERIERVTAERSRVARTAPSEARNARLNELEAQERQLMTEADELQGEVLARNPRYSALFHPKPLSPAEIRDQLLMPDSLLLEYFIARDRLYLFALTREGDHWLQAFEIQDPAGIEQAAAFFQRKRFESAGELQSRLSYQSPEFTRIVQYLSDKLLGPVEPLLQKRKIWIVSDGGLQRIPFAALPDPRKASSSAVTGSDSQSVPQTSITPLIVEHEIVELPSASTVVWLRRMLAARPPASGTIAVLADPVFSASDARVKFVAPETEPKPASLPQQLKDTPDLQQTFRSLETESPALRRLAASRDEAQAIAKLAPGRSLIALDFDANRQMVLDGALANFRYLHFATHAYVDDDLPGLSWLALSQVDSYGREQPGFLRLNDIYQLRLNADLVVLGGCRTGLGQQLRGEGMVGLTRGFFYAGVPRVMASLWEVPDRETSDLMQTFYRNLLKEKLPYGEALRQAQLEMWKRPESNAPFFWAAFNLQGDPRE